MLGGGWETSNHAKYLPFYFMKLALLTSLVKDYLLCPVHFKVPFIVTPAAKSKPTARPHPAAKFHPAAKLHPAAKRKPRQTA